MKINRLSTLAVGTEITEGQISDRNSQWLSARAVQMGYEVTEHRAVPDDRAVILRSLRELSSAANLILVTGGLGPTSDDFTRECIAEFVEQPLEWHETSWIAILERFRHRGAPVTENQKQQCFFPRDAIVFKNPNGTANGFSVTSQCGTRVVALPGPPDEIRGIWNEGLRSSLVLDDQANRRTLTLLRTMGLGEGALAHRIEEIIDETMSAEFATLARPSVGYRATAPYVEIKLWANVDQVQAVARISEAIRREFHDIIVNEGDQDLADSVLSRIANESAAGRRTILFDGLTQGAVIARIFNRAKERGEADLMTALSAENFTGVIGDFKFSAIPSVSRLEISKGVGDLDIRIASDGNEKHLTLPRLASNLGSERGRKWIGEFALREWGRT